MPRDYAGQPPPPAAAPYAYDHGQYHRGPLSHVHTSGHPINLAGNNPAASSPMAAGSSPRDGNGDVAMHDANDAHAGIKYPMRPHHQSHPSSGRSSNLQSPHDPQPSSAAQRYSPMDTLSPTSPYAPKSSQFANPPSQSQSPSGQAEYPQSPYYAGHQGGQHLPPITPFSSAQDGYPSSTVSNLDAAYSNGPKSPARPNPPVQKPVPEFHKLRNLTELRPKNNRQPLFRRANPEGGFISVSILNDMAIFNRLLAMTLTMVRNTL